MALFTLNKIEIDKNIKILEDDLVKQRTMLDYLIEENKEEVDNSEFFAWHIVKIMESNDPQKKQKISKLLNTISNNINTDLITQF